MGLLRPTDVAGVKTPRQGSSGPIPLPTPFAVPAGGRNRGSIPRAVLDQSCDRILDALGRLLDGDRRPLVEEIENE